MENVLFEQILVIGLLVSFYAGLVLVWFERTRKAALIMLAVPVVVFGLMALLFLTVGWAVMVVLGTLMGLGAIGAAIK